MTTNRRSSIVVVTALVSLALLVTFTFSAADVHGEEGHDQAIHWSYVGEEGPDFWSELSPDFALCGTGESQSPIDLAGSFGDDTGEFSIQYQPTELNAVNNGHTIQMGYDRGSCVELDGNKYELLQLHFHKGSEHTLNGRQFPMEMHLVHKNANGEPAVVGVLLDVGKEANEAFNTLWAYLPTTAAERRTIPAISFSASDLLPDDRSYLHYQGSLTTPPCSEGVQWYVMTQPVLLSQVQIDAYGAFYDGNFRPVQPLRDRPIVTSD